MSDVEATQQFVETCRALSQHLAANGRDDWAATFERLGSRAEDADGSAGAREAASDALALYGGMGSFADLVLMTSTADPREPDERLDRLRSALHRAAVALR
ncbi:hypothetical protein NY547_07735 [Cnuibacter physcomitrellae]|uniref:DUF6966 domain-containing protein n=1 Tax=Cnuibacter physcomitrellae TaxID=1619308 RepID=UPI0021761007|nr:hypothetical protein [Cnuibacter physcomitrellae]MCS5497123.1 hypothetical protein [Cnuibacter physcomitrellae]